jgi:hypothetical protein
VVAALDDAAQWAATERWGNIEELLASQLELAAIARSEFLKAHGVKSPPKPLHVKRPGQDETVKPSSLFAHLKGGGRG